MVMRRERVDVQPSMDTARKIWMGNVIQKLRILDEVGINSFQIWAF